MTQAIIYTNENGGVSVCIPTGELPIEAVQAKDTPVGSIIVDITDLPQDNEFFNAWELVDGQVIVNQNKKEAIQKETCKTKAKELLTKTDWSQVGDVGLSNKADFDNYRAILRGYVISPITDPTWPTEPQPVWG